MSWNPWDIEEDRDDRRADLLNRGIAAMSDGRTLKRFLAATGGLNLLIWLAVILVPFDVRSAFERVHELNDKIAVVVMGIVFGIGMCGTYSILRLKFPDIEDVQLESDVLGSYAYGSRSTKRWFVWLFSAIGGVLNALGVFIVGVWLTSP